MQIQYSVVIGHFDAKLERIKSDHAMPMPGSHASQGYDLPQPFTLELPQPLPLLIPQVCDYFIVLPMSAAASAEVTAPSADH